MNYRMVGVFLASAIWSFVISKYEKFALRQVSPSNLSFLVTLAMATPHWLWYGEKAGINAIIIWVVLSFLYRVSLSLFRSSGQLQGLPTRNRLI